jgi:BirA family biotin operon repressor/biotin-[acetyl-CoA-carboxylase] ligase
MNIGAVVRRLPSCLSTNEVAKTLAQEGAEEGTVVIAEEQTEGKGTKGRRWHSPRGLGLYASVILRPRRRDISLLPIVAGIACVEGVRESAGVELRLKWPNDIVWEGKKLGGILSESGFLGRTPSYAILGIGLNVNQKRIDFPPEIKSSATSLLLAAGKAVDRMRLEDSVWSSLERWYGRFRRGRKREIVSAFESSLIFRVGTVIHIQTGKENLQGTFRGIDTQSRLILERAGKMMRLSPAEILQFDYHGNTARRRKSPSP